MSDRRARAARPPPAARRRAILSRRAASRRQFGGLVAVNDVSFDDPASARSSRIIGPNGAGKTTFFNMLTGLYKPSTGRIVLRRQRHHPDAART